MSWLKVTGMIPAEANNAWVSGTLTATPLRAEDEGWADGTRRAVWPIEGVLAGAGTRVEARQGGDFYLPGANIGESAVPPSIELLAELKDQQGRTRRFRSVGKVAASALGEWSLNAPLGSVIVKGQNSGPNSWLETTVADVVAATELARAQTAAQAAQMADTAQASALAVAAAGIIGKTNLAAITGADGYYRAMDTGYVYQRNTTGGVSSNVRRTDLEAAPLSRLVTTERNVGNKKTAASYGASGGRSLDDRSSVQNAIDSILSAYPEGGGYLDLSAARGFIISEALYIPKGITIDFGSGTPIEQTTWGKPHFYIENADDVHFKGVAQLLYLGARPNIKAAPSPTSGDPRLNANYQSTGAGNTRNLAAGVYIRHKCDRFTADHVYVKGQVIGMSHNTFGADDIYYSDDNQVGLLHVEDVDFGYLSGGFRRFKIGTVKAKNILTSQGDPSHAVYVGPRTVPNTSLEIGSIDMDGGALVVDADDSLGASDAFSIRSTDQVHVGNVKTRNTQYLGNVQSGKIQIASINAVLLPLVSGVTTNGLAAPFAAQSNALVTIGESRIESAIGWSAGRQDSFLYSVSSGAELRVRESYTDMTADSPGRVAKLQSSGAYMEFANPEIRYKNDFAAGFVQPAAFAATPGGQFRAHRPKLTGTDRLFITTATGADWRINLDPTRIANNTTNTVLDSGNKYQLSFTGQHDTPPVEPPSAGTYGIPLRSRNTLTVSNIAPAALGGFTSGTQGQRYMVFCTDAFTVLQNNASIKLLGNADLAKGTWSWIEFVMVAGIAYEIGHGGTGVASTITKTTAYTLTTATKVLLANATGAAFTITLPTAIGIADTQFVIKKTDASANAVTVATTASQTIDGAATRSVATQYATLRVVSDGANWQVI